MFLNIICSKPLRVLNNFESFHLKIEKKKTQQFHFNTKAIWNFTCWNNVIIACNIYINGNNIKYETPQNAFTLHTFNPKMKKKTKKNIASTMTVTIINKFIYLAPTESKWRRKTKHKSKQSIEFNPSMLSGRKCLACF